MFCPSCKKLMRPRPSQGVWVCQKCGTNVRMEVSGATDSQISSSTAAQFEYRPGQEEIISEIVAEAKKGTRLVLLEAPVGAGKSVILTDVAQTLHRDLGWTGYYTTPQVSLVEQLRSNSVTQDKVQTIMGLDNYFCAIDRAPKDRQRRVSEAWCMPHIGRPCDNCLGRGTLPSREGTHRCPVCQGKRAIRFSCPEKYRSCQYFLDRKKAAQGALATMTLAYLLHVTKDPLDANEKSTGTPIDVVEAPRFHGRDFLIIDEAHGLEDYVSLLSIDVYEQTLVGKAWGELWASDLKEIVDQTDDHFQDLDTDGIRNILTRLRKGAQAVLTAEDCREDTDKGDDLRSIRRLNKTRQLDDKLEAALEDLDAGNPWVAQIKVEDSTRYLKLTPVFSQKILSRKLWPLGPKMIIISTATILDPHQFLWEVGLPEEGFKHLCPPSTFPPANGPIFVDPSVNLSSKYTERNLPAAMDILRSIMDRHRDERGLIHVTGYELQRRVADSLPASYRSRLVVHNKGVDRNRTLSQWMRDGSQDTVLIAVAMEEGLDLKGELAQWQVILKCPYAGLKDRRVQERKRMPDGDRWYKMQALRRLLQSFGRVVRSDSDIGWTYILDSTAGELLNEHWDILPEWVQERLKAGRHIAEQGFQRPLAIQTVGKQPHPAGR